MSATKICLSDPVEMGGILIRKKKVKLILANFCYQVPKRSQVRIPHEKYKVYLFSWFVKKIIFFKEQWANLGIKYMEKSVYVYIVELKNEEFFDNYVKTLNIISKICKNGSAGNLTRVTGLKGVYPLQNATISTVILVWFNPIKLAKNINWNLHRQKRVLKEFQHCESLIYKSECIFNLFWTKLEFLPTLP